MQAAHETEVLVVGAGPVGMLTALLLAEGGIQVQLIDQEARTAGHSYACALHPRTLTLLDQLGLADEAIALGRRVHMIGLCEGPKREAEIKLYELPAKFPFVLVLPQSAFEDLLERRLKRQGNVLTSWNHRLADLEMDGHGVTVSIEKLAPTGKGYPVPDFGLGVQKVLPVRAEFVVGADGHQSMVRQRLGLKYETLGDPELYAVYEVGYDGKLSHEMEVVVHDSTVSVLWPLTENKCRWSFQMPNAAPIEEFPGKDRSRLIIGDPAEGEARLKQLLSERAPWFHGSFREIEWSTEIQFEHQLASRFGEGRCWLAGDAAHQTGPVGMRSMNIGLIEAADLAGRLKQILRAEAPVESLQGYGREHRAEWQRLLGQKEEPKLTAEASAWARKNARRILASLPASGRELSLLLAQLGLEWD